MKKIVSLILTIIVLCCFESTIMASQIAQTQENNGNITLTLWSGGSSFLQPVNCSDNAHMRVSTSCMVLSATDGTKYEVKTEEAPWIEYTVEANKSGGYSMHWTGVSYNLASRSSGYWDITVNPGDNERKYVINKDTCTILSENGALADYNYVESYVFLNQGINTIRITALECNSDYSSNLRRLMIQNIVFLKRLENVKATTSQEYIKAGESTNMNFTDGGTNSFDSSHDSIDSIKYTSLDPNIATVNDDGMITALNPGKCEIKIEITDKIGEIIESVCQVVVQGTNGIILDDVWIDDGKIYTKYTSTTVGANATLAIVGYNEVTDEETSQVLKTEIKNLQMIEISPAVGILTTSEGIEWDIAKDGNIIEVFTIDTFSEFNQIFPVMRVQQAAGNN